ncbi:MAG: Sec-independent protein translocase protein TatB [Pseudomonadales bacterium]
MFDIGFPELMIVAVVMLLVLGPERLPETLRMLGLWLGRLRRSFNAVKTEIEREVGMDEIKRQLHNEAIMDEMKRLETQVKTSVEPAAATDVQGAPEQPPTPAAAPEVTTTPDNTPPSTERSE